MQISKVEIHETILKLLTNSIVHAKRDFELAKEFGYKVFSVVLENRHGNTNEHNVPEDKIEQMKKSILKLTTVIVILFAFTQTINAQSFEGVIEFKKSSSSDTSSYVYTVKGNQVRIDEIGSKSRKVEGSFLVDMDAKTMKFINHDRKLYGDQNTPAANVIKGNCVVKKGQNVKNLQTSVAFAFVLLF